MCFRGNMSSVACVTSVAGETFIYLSFLFYFHRRKPTNEMVVSVGIPCWVSTFCLDGVFMSQISPPPPPRCQNLLLGLSIVSLFPFSRSSSTFYIFLSFPFSFLPCFYFVFWYFRYLFLLLSSVVVLWPMSLKEIKIQNVELFLPYFPVLFRFLIF